MPWLSFVRKAGTVSAHGLAPMLGKTPIKLWGTWAPCSVSKYNIKCCSSWVWKLFGKSLSPSLIQISSTWWLEDSPVALLSNSIGKSVSLSLTSPKTLNPHQSSQKLYQFNISKCIGERSPIGVIKVAGASLNAKQPFFECFVLSFSGTGWQYDLPIPSMRQETKF